MRRAARKFRLKCPACGQFPQGLRLENQGQRLRHRRHRHAGREEDGRAFADAAGKADGDRGKTLWSGAKDRRRDKQGEKEEDGGLAG